ncbi:helix-turn-helix domain-containing protein [Leekyejoonella antrihumi]|uniref:Helix-turn-helix domain-containing protein n=1 Tax=Leekyejoonella antrihumi TaxID=1660198 RepID=A0A563E226_9MICO|nr:helix-turn-helix domain-containing protein [Leekyejoonella antrihumi]TWP36600.1 helix-turn-helix domain-containing protein [Leekyejoonella antrihumi]
MSTVGHDVQVFSAASTAPADRFEAWQAAVNATFVPLRAMVRSADGYQGGLLAQDLGEVTATEVGGSPVTVRRDKASIAASNPGVYKLGLQLHGYCILSQDGREAALTPGDLAIYDTTRPYTLDFAESYRMFVLLIPRDRLGLSPEQIGQLTAERISGRQGLGALTSTLLAQLGAQVRSGGADTDPRAVDAIVELVRAALSQRLDLAGTVPGASVVFSAATAWIDEHLSASGLEVEDVALAQHVSVRYLQKLFADRGTTPSAWIRQRRLRRCRVDLLDPALAAHPVAAIGARWGFGDPSGFARTFKSGTGMTPGEFRATGGA